MSGRKVVLVVEDDPAIQKLIRRNLEALGVEVALASGGRSAVEQLSQRHFDLVCLDLMLPELSGFEVCRYVRQTLKLLELPILVLSARSLPEDRAHAEEAGATAYLTKPFSRGDFNARIQELLAAVPARPAQSKMKG